MCRGRSAGRREGGKGAAGSWDRVLCTTLTHTAEACNRQHHLHIVSHVSIRQLVSIYLELADMLPQLGLLHSPVCPTNGNDLVTQQFMQAYCVADIQHTVLAMLQVCASICLLTYCIEQSSVPG